jgi:hypothetical protein
MPYPLVTNRVSQKPYFRSLFRTGRMPKMASWLAFFSAEFLTLHRPKKNRTKPKTVMRPTMA